MILFLILKRLACCAPEFSIIFSLVKASTLVPAKSLIFLLCWEIEFLQDLSCTQLPASVAKALLLLLFLWDGLCWSMICNRKTQHSICLKWFISAKDWFCVKIFWSEAFLISASYDIGFWVFTSPLYQILRFSPHSKKGQVAENTIVMFSICFTAVSLWIRRKI